MMYISIELSRETIGLEVCTVDLLSMLGRVVTGASAEDILVQGGEPNNHGILSNMIEGLGGNQDLG
jgi:hypothetical protein